MSVYRDFFKNGKLMDYRYNVANYEQYLLDVEPMQFTKMCMTEIVSADMMIATFGEEPYTSSCKEVLDSVSKRFKELGLDDIIHIYIHSYRHFIITANDAISDSTFEHIVRQFHAEYELSTSQQTALSGVSRFVLTFGEDLVNRSKSALFMHKESPNTFIVATNEKERLLAEKQNDVQMFELINYALSNNRVIPFYQGIRDNATGQITKYEALMRIRDIDDSIRSPYTFLNSAKELKLYIPLSKMMVHKALIDFERKSSGLNINISLLDIMSDDYQDWFIERVKAHPNPAQITVEFIETENYGDAIIIKDFLERVRDIGCKVAADDFGSGFATYSAIVSLKPDIIKIDGSIIKGITTQPNNKIIVDSICYMARLIGAKIVAEFVENEDIQNAVVSSGVDFSQGYLYSVPKPIEELDIV